MVTGKNRIRRAFAGAVTSYDAAAVVQRKVAECLLEGIAGTVFPDRILDLGAGTGHGQGLLCRRWPGAAKLALDMALPMLVHGRHGKALRICGDAESMPLASETIGFVWSNLSMQWCDPQKFLSEVGRMLYPGGEFVISTLGPQTFAELRSAFSGIDSYSHTLRFRTHDYLLEAIAKAELSLSEHMRLTITSFHPNLRSLLSEVRGVGASNVTHKGRSGLMGKSAWNAFVTTYEKQRGVLGIPLSYDVALYYGRR